MDCICRLIFIYISDKINHYVNMLLTIHLLKSSISTGL